MKELGTRQRALLETLSLIYTEETKVLYAVSFEGLVTLDTLGILVEKVGNLFRCPLLFFGGLFFGRSHGKKGKEGNDLWKEHGNLMNLWIFKIQCPAASTENYEWVVVVGGLPGKVITDLWCLKTPTLRVPKDTPRHTRNAEPAWAVVDSFDFSANTSPGSILMREILT
jgi:hypothetical protein